jgi:hypothetical protein
MRGKSFVSNLRPQQKGEYSTLCFEHNIDIKSVDEEAANAATAWRSGHNFNLALCRPSSLPADVQESLKRQV